MKRSERFTRQARHHAGMGTSFLAVSVAAGVWAVRAWQSTMPGGAVVLAGALAVLCLAERHFRQSARLAHLALMEEVWEIEREPEVKL